MSEVLRPEPRLEELVERTEGLQPWRRVAHLVVGSGIAFAVYRLSPLSATHRWLLVGMLAMVFVTDLVRLRYEAFNRLCFRSFGRLLSPHEADSLSLTWFLLGVILVLWFPGRSVAVPSILVLAAADPAASVVGYLGGTRPLGKGSLEGTSAFFVVATAVLVPFVGIPTALPVAAVGAATEAFTTLLDDNLVIPVVTAVCLSVSGLA